MRKVKRKYTTDASVVTPARLQLPFSRTIAEVQRIVIQGSVKIHLIFTLYLLS